MLATESVSCSVMERKRGLRSKVDVQVPGGGTRIVAGDFNGDGWPDLAATWYAGDKITVFLNSTRWTGLP
jgi:hypothetical protein